MKISFKISLAVILISTAFFAGCSNIMDNNSSNTVAGDFLTISPADNSQNIGINDAVTIQFASSVDAKTIETNFVLISQKDIADSLCPISKNMGHSDMNKAMMDTSMMTHLKNMHCTKGTFSWNSDKTKCEFKPDSSLEPNTDYMMYIDSEMMNHMKSLMSNNGMMKGGMGMMNCDCGNKGLDESKAITHFRTRAN